VLALAACGDDAASAGTDGDTSSGGSTSTIASDTSTDDTASPTTSSSDASTSMQTSGSPDTDADTTAGDTGEPDDGAWPPSCTPFEIGSVCQGDGGVCGDGVLQSCEVCGGGKDEGGSGSGDGGAGPECEIASEPCDGVELGENTCSSLGYSGGVLACDEWCGLDIRDCDSCLDAPQVLECRRPRVDVVEVYDLELATDGETIAAAWIGHDDMLGFARFDASLEPLGTTPCTALADGHDLALARVPGGWWVAVGGTGGGPEVVLMELDDDGALVGTLRTIADATNPVLVTRPDALPVLLYDRTESAAAYSVEVVAEQLEADGDPLWESSLGNALWAEETSAARVGDGMLVAVRSTEGDQDTLVVPIDGAGGVGTAQPLPGTYHLELSATIDGAAGVWRGPDGWVWGRFDAAGSLATAEVGVGPQDPTTATQEAVVVATGGRSLAAVTQAQRTELEAVHVDDDASIGADAYTIAIEPNELTEIEGIAVGDEIVLGWIGYSLHPSRARFVLARVQP
jgi:hypothetical protein